MTNVWDYFKNFFREAEQSSASNPILKGMLERSAEEQRAYADWVGTLSCRRLMSLLAEQYAMHQSNPAGVDPALTFLRTPSTNGFAFHFDRLDFKKNDAHHLLDLLKEKTLGLNYRPTQSDTRTWSEKDWVQTVERHYLKPRQTWAEGQKINQQFGNVSIELTLRNDQPRLLTFRATSYADRLYAEASDFHELMQSILA
ncbi:MAG: hypothetical protein MUC59_02685 [Saprospiraceae bacterium]|jgi:hypothetical protein|nr:hypothetical protein [Saprospiraceae bacterium]